MRKKCASDYWPRTKRQTQRKHTASPDHKYFTRTRTIAPRRPAVQIGTNPDPMRTGAASVLLLPLHGMFGIIGANGLHFERRRQRWVDIDPAVFPLDIAAVVFCTTSIKTAK
jgi:hypothetical protein